jgi:hypothetical protein
MCFPNAEGMKAQMKEKLAKGTGIDAKLYQRNKATQEALKLLGR